MRYGSAWRDYLPQSTFGLFDIRDIIDHVIDKANRLFADTRYKHTWKIYHDALPQWWEKGAQDHLQERGSADRQWRASGPTNDNIARYYRDKLMGDSPELMPLDSSLFGDLIENVAWLVIATKNLPEIERCSMATPDKAWATMCQAWEQVPEAQIGEDIGRFPMALRTNLTAKGCYVSDMDLRHGHRALMQRLVRGGGEEENATANAVEEKIKKGLLAAMASWEGLTADLEACLLYTSPSPRDRG